MFDLEAAISSWRAQLAASGIKSPEQLTELEAHLREDIDRQTRFGLGTQQAFDLAVQNLGNPPVLGAEFNKTKRGRSITERLMLGVSGLLLGFILFLSSVTIVMCYQGWGERMVALAGVAAILLAARGWTYTIPWLPVITDRRWQWAAGLGCIAVGFIAANVFCVVVLPYFEFRADPQLPAIGVWAVFLLAAFSCTGVALLLSKRQREMCSRKRARLSSFI